MPKFAVPVWVYVETDTEQKAVAIADNLVDYILDLDGRRGVDLYDMIGEGGAAIYDMTVGDDICPVDDNL